MQRFAIVVLALHRPGPAEPMRGRSSLSVVRALHDERERRTTAASSRFEQCLRQRSRHRRLLRIATRSMRPTPAPPSPRRRSARITLGVSAASPKKLAISSIVIQRDRRS